MIHSKIKQDFVMVLIEIKLNNFLWLWLEKWVYVVDLEYYNQIVWRYKDFNSNN